jgi:outer membrane lipoprotein SlyB
MTNTILTPSVPSEVAPAPKGLWAAVFVLSVTTLAMGAALVQTHMQPTAQLQPLPQIQTVANPTPTLTPPMPLKSEQVNAFEEVITAQPKMASANIAPPAIKTVANDARHRAAPPSAPVAKSPVQAQTVVPAGADSGAVVAQASSPLVLPVPQEVCLQCATVVAVTAQQREPEQGSGVGAVAGAVLGGLLGNQFGGGDGKAILTVAGALGGGWAGNTVEKRMKKEVVYLVDLRMQDGSMRRVEQNTPAVVGDRVTVKSGVILPRGQDGVTTPGSPLLRDAST